MSSSLRAVLLLAALLGALAGCGPPRVRIKRMLPPRVDLAMQKPIAVEVDENAGGLAVQSAAEVVHGAGESVSRHGSKGDVLGMASDALNGLDQVGRPMRAVTVAEALKRNLEESLRRSEYKVAGARDAEVIVRARPTDWTLRKGRWRLESQVDIVRKGKDGRLIYRFEYRTRVKAQSQQDALKIAAESLADQFVKDLRPGNAWQTVELDDDDPIVQPGIELCEEGEIGAAFRAFADAVARAPDSGPALYNLALLTDARGDYDAAEALLLRALRNDPKPLYEAALARTRAAQAEARELREARTSTATRRDD